MSSWIAVLQLPLVFLPLVVMGLGVFGSDFDEVPGRLFIGLFLALPLLDRFAGEAVGRATRGAAGSWLPLLAVALAGIAYRPVHLEYWDEHSTRQALAYGALGLASWAVFRMGVAGLRERGASTGALAGALLCIAPAWLVAGLYPLLPTLGLGALFALVALLGGPRGAAAAPAPAWRPRPASALAAWGALLLGIDLFLVVWDLRTDLRWGGHLFAAFGAASLGVALARRWGAALLWLGAANFAGLCLYRPWVLHHGHSVLAGLALGALLARAFRGGGTEPRRPSPLSHWTLFWTLGVILGLSLHQHLAFAPLRILLLLPPVWLALRGRPRTVMP